MCVYVFLSFYVIHLSYSYKYKSQYLSVLIPHLSSFTISINQLPLNIFLNGEKLKK